MSKPKEQWGTRLGVILAVAGSAVGLGNFLRFPGQAAQNGGGAFMIPYFCALLFLGIPICWAEWTMGRYGGAKGLHSAPSILGMFGRGRSFRYLGVMGVMIPLAVSFYYTYIEAWCLGYFWHYLTGGGIGVDPGTAITDQTARASQFYNDFTGRGENGVIAGGSIQTFVFWVITFAVNIWLVFRGISKGIEKFVQWAMPMMAVCALIVLARVLTLGTPDPTKPDQNVINGLGYMWNPNYEALTNPQTWLAAAGQIFFSLSVGFGVIINYASYLKRDHDVVLSGLTASATNELFEVGFGGMITLTAAFIFLGTANMIGAVQGGTFGLGFTTLPVVFAHMGSFGNVIGAVFFFMLFLAAITSSISMYQPSLAFFEEALGCSRKAATTLMVSICVLGSFLVMYFSKDGIFWSTIDDWIGTFMIYVLAMVQVVAFSWVFGVKKGIEEAHHGAEMRIPGVVNFVLKYVTPTYLLVVFGAFCVKTLPGWIQSVAGEPLRIGAIALLVVVITFLLICTMIGEKRWRAQGLDIDGREPLPMEKGSR
ncbi:MAG: sodium-dependent transporter [Phycisphaerae bacterium]|nr:MAG: sodium:calcium symporter [Planctomycetota bacterium]KAB2944255.1 MAG: sodium:calcium symporter [Phycisphaerae bacterium]MBE7456366.1 sodium-dependent transporter [Planctomycetia bacterium]MCK6465696.1 sodium-dependent transporter [Phycisphaerae bacterium]MCL4718484.1 sodium-dependent transporter [Phycisphaerae bacterium]